MGVPNLAEAAFKKLGIAELIKPPKKRRTTSKMRKKRGKSFVYSPKLISQFGSGIVLEGILC